MQRRDCVVEVTVVSGKNSEKPGAQHLFTIPEEDKTCH